jgi:energy-coupling factor transporter ATP-binding protein EcfA2
VSKIELELEFQPNKPYCTKGTLIVFDSNEKPLYSDTLDIASAKKRKGFVKEVTTICQAVSQEQLELRILEEIARIAAERRKASEKAVDEQQVDPLESTSQEVKDAALELLKSDSLFEQISADIRDIGVAGEEELALMIYIVMTSRLLDKPLSAIVLGASASGKSYIIETVAKLMPPEGVVQAHDFSDQALYYLPSGSLRHKVVVSGERVQEHRGSDGHAEDNSKAFREMVAGGELRKAVTVKGPDGKPKTALIYQPGPIAYLESSTAANIHDEDSTRLLPLATDESATQTKRIVEAQRQEAKGQAISKSKRQRIVERHHAMQRLLKACAVRIPYSDSILLPEAKIVTRRANEQFFSAIRSVALLRQYQKPNEQVEQHCIDADEIDYEIVYRVIKGVLTRKYSPLNQQSRDLLQTVLEQTGAKADSGATEHTDFTQQECENWSGTSNTTVRRRLKPLLSAGIVAVDDTHKPYRYKVVNPQLAEGADLNLPTPEDISERIAIMLEQSSGILADVS